MRKKPKKEVAAYMAIDLYETRVLDELSNIRQRVAKAKSMGKFKGLVLDIFPWTHLSYDAECKIARYLAKKEDWHLEVVGDLSLQSLERRNDRVVEIKGGRSNDHRNRNARR